jgi:hypothetical protein
MSMLVIVPSRGRPENIDRLNKAWADTGAISTQLLIGLDDDDPTIGQYHGWCEIGPRERMAGTLNRLAVKYAPQYDYLAFLGDDHVVRTPDWDRTITTELDTLGTGIVYGNDLLQGETLPTAVFMTSDIVRALGWMALPGARHLFLDSAWLALGRALDAITYLPDVVIEHMHPLVGKADSDDGYAANNDHETWTHDKAVYEAWVAEGLTRDVAKIRAFRG